MWRHIEFVEVSLHRVLQEPYVTPWLTCTVPLSLRAVLHSS